MPMWYLQLVFSAGQLIVQLLLTDRDESFVYSVFFHFFMMKFFSFFHFFIFLQNLLDSSLQTIIKKNVHDASIFGFFPKY